MAVKKDDPTGPLYIFDWKRCKKLSFKGFAKGGEKALSMKSPLDAVEDCNGSHYVLQLNLYRHILETEYGRPVLGMYLGVFHPHQDIFQHVEILPHDDWIQYILWAEAVGNRCATSSEGVPICFSGEDAKIWTSTEGLCAALPPESDSESENEEKNAPLGPKVDTELSMAILRRNTGGPDEGANAKPTPEHSQIDPVDGMALSTADIYERYRDVYAQPKIETYWEQPAMRNQDGPMAANTEPHQITSQEEPNPTFKFESKIELLQQLKVLREKKRTASETEDFVTAGRAKKQMVDIKERIASMPSRKSIIASIETLTIEMRTSIAAEDFMTAGVVQAKIKVYQMHLDTIPVRKTIMDKIQTITAAMREASAAEDFDVAATKKGELQALEKNLAICELSDTDE